MKNDLNFPLGLLQGFQEIAQPRIVFAAGAQLSGGFGSQVGELLQVAADKLKQFFVNTLPRFLVGLAQLCEGDKDFTSGTVAGSIENLQPARFGFFEELHNVDPAAFQKSDIGGIKDIGGDAGGIDNQRGSFFLGSFLGDAGESRLNKQHSLLPDFGAELSEP